MIPSRKRRACISLGIRFQISGMDFSSVIIRALRSFRQPSNVGQAGVRRRKNLKNRAKCGKMVEKLSQVIALINLLLFFVDKRIWKLRLCCIYPERAGPVIGEGNGHFCAEFSGLNGDALGFHTGDEIFVKRLGVFRFGGA
tara:strand:+ start:398 stop:820 length:423 start_codon:yes stop_codon:yes gene_type:complete